MQPCTISIKINERLSVENNQPTKLKNNVDWIQYSVKFNAEQTNIHYYIVISKDFCKAIEILTFISQLAKQKVGWLVPFSRK